ncbi:MAG: M14 family zinc carboxypeptidase [Phycisphaerales bacterium]|nr:M14 family zinc carboxypeptidase [Phycisphaerales bacterium]
MFISIVLTTHVLLSTTTEPIRQWRTPTELTAAFDSFSTKFSGSSITTIGQSNNQLPIQCLTIAREGTVLPKDRPAILVVAGIDGDHLLGTEVAFEVAQFLLGREDAETKEVLQNNTFYIIPQVNPDGAALYFRETQEQHRMNIRQIDNDRDGLFDEDGGDDLNGDGFITMMRVHDLEKATSVEDPKEPRLDKMPDSLEGEAAEFILYTEGIDNDGDGEFNEDGIGGVDINKNFMHGYVSHGDGAGPWQLSEPESKALLDFVLDHQEISAVVVYGQHDTLTNPLKENGNDDAGAPKTVSKEDEKIYEQISKTFVEITELKEVDHPNWDGSFVAWAYAQFGVPAFSTPLWSRPSSEDSSENEEAKPVAVKKDTNLTPSDVGDISQETVDELLQAAEAAGFPVTEEMMAEITPDMIERYAKMSGVQVKKVTSDSRGISQSKGETAWLAYSDACEGAGFVDWEPFDHPQLGTVEIGGWVPYFKTLPPIDQIGSISEKQVEFLLELANRLPKVHLGAPIITKLGSDLWEVKVPVVNDGWFPSGMAIAKKNKRARPFVVRIDIPNETIVSGRKVERIWALEGGGTKKWFRWIIQGNAAPELSITLFSEKYGTEVTTLPLKETKGGDA